MFRNKWKINFQLLGFFLLVAEEGICEINSHSNCVARKRHFQSKRINPWSARGRVLLLAGTNLFPFEGWSHLPLFPVLFAPTLRRVVLGEGRVVPAVFSDL